MISDSIYDLSSGINQLYGSKIIKIGNHAQEFPRDLLLKIDYFIIILTSPFSESKSESPIILQETLVTMGELQNIILSTINLKYMPHQRNVSDFINSIFRYYNACDYLGAHSQRTDLVNSLSKYLDHIKGCTRKACPDLKKAAFAYSKFKKFDGLGLDIVHELGKVLLSKWDYIVTNSVADMSLQTKSWFFDRVLDNINETNAFDWFSRYTSIVKGSTPHKESLKLALDKCQSLLTEKLVLVQKHDQAMAKYFTSNSWVDEIIALDLYELIKLEARDTRCISMLLAINECYKKIEPSRNDQVASTLFDLRKFLVAFVSKRWLSLRHSKNYSKLDKSILAEIAIAANVSLSEIL